MKKTIKKDIIFKRQQISIFDCCYGFGNVSFDEVKSEINKFEVKLAEFSKEIKEPDVEFRIVSEGDSPGVLGFFLEAYKIECEEIDVVEYKEKEGPMLDKWELAKEQERDMQREEIRKTKKDIDSLPY